jgi:hypothetical protein
MVCRYVPGMYKRTRSNLLVDSPVLAEDASESIDVEEVEVGWRLG